MLVDVDTFVNEHGSYRETSSCRLVCDKVEADHALSLFLDDLRCLYNMDTSFHSTGEMSFTTATSLDLSLNHESPLVGESLCDIKGFLGCTSKFSPLHIDSERGHKFLAVILVEVEETSCWCEQAPLF